MSGEEYGPMHDLVGAYALHALDNEERAAFEAHLETCTRCQDELTALTEAASFLAEGVATDPPGEMRSRVLGAVADQPQESGLDAVAPADVDTDAQADADVQADVDVDVDTDVDAVVDLADRRRSAGRWLLTAAAALILVAGIGLGVLLAARTGGGDSVDNVVAAADARRLQLDGEPGRLEVVWSAEEDRVAIIGDGLDDSGGGRIYALWFVLADGSSVAPAGLFDPVDGSVAEVLDVDDIEAVGWGVTIEPDGGSPQPTGPILYIGSF
ncbi:MAG: anti-sigma factor [Actinomycetota bacterium]